MRKELLELFNKVKEINNRYETVARVNAEKFNIFEILGLSSNEVRTHSAFLANLLNPDGFHNQGDTFLKLFLKSIKWDNFTTNSCKVEIEKYIGKIDVDLISGGRIDILISSENKAIIIENKIYAIEQPRQLERYFRYAEKERKFEDFRIIYLTLLGEKPVEISEENIEKEELLILSYQKEIREWLELCIREVALLPNVREVLNQYLRLILNLTGSGANQSQIMEIKEILKINRNYQLVADMETAFETLKIEILKSFLYAIYLDLIDSAYQKEEFKIEEEKGFYGFSLKISDRIEYEGIKFTIECSTRKNGYTKPFYGLKIKRKEVLQSNLYNELKTKFNAIQRESDDPNNPYWIGFKYVVYKEYDFVYLKSEATESFIEKGSESEIFKNTIEEIKNIYKNYKTTLNQ